MEHRDGFVELDFGEFKFVSYADANALRSNLKKLVEACGLEPSEFEVITI